MSEPLPDQAAGPRIAPSLRTAVILFVVLPCAAMLLAWIWIKVERGALKDRGQIACNARKHDEAWCKKAADEHHERCIELTYRAGTKTAGESFDTVGYVECLDVGPEQFWKLAAERERARAGQITFPPGPYYH